MQKSIINNINCRRIFFIFCFLQLSLWTLSPTFTYSSLPHDVAEGLAWGNQWMLGYSKMPPFTAWMLAIFTKVGNGVIGLPIYLLAQICVIITYIFVWKLSVRLANQKVALLSILLLVGILYYNNNSANITPDTMSTPMWAAIIFFTYTSFKDNKLLSWYFLGIALALAMLTKYSAIILIFVLLICTLSTKETQQRYKSKGPYISIAISLLIFFPHLIWSINHNFSAIQYILHSALSGDDNPLTTVAFEPLIGRHFAVFIGAIISQTSAFLPVFILAWPLWLSLKKGGKQKPIIQDSFDRNFIYTIAFGPYVVTLLYAALSGGNVIPRWSTPYFSFIGLWLILVLRSKLTNRVLKQVIFSSFIVFFSILIGRTIYVLSMPIYKNTSGNDLYFNMPSIVTETYNIWKKHYSNPLLYVSGDHYLTAYVTDYSNNKLIPFFDADLSSSPWIELNDFKKRGAIFVFQNYGEFNLPDKIHHKFPSLIYAGNYKFQNRYLLNIGSNNAGGIHVAFYLLPPSP